MKPYVKICGLTNLEDTMECLELGANFLGFIFAQDPRKISIAAAEEIVRIIPKTVKSVAVFKNNSLIYINEILKRIRFDLVQLHGNESMGYISYINKPVIKSFDLTEKEIGIKIKKYKGTIPLLDLPKDYEGDMPIDVAREISRRQLIMIRGKITEENLIKIIEAVRPWCIDVCSGVEKEIGKKDKQKLKNLFRLIERIK